MGRDLPSAPPTLDAVRARIDQVDGELLRLIDERASLAAAVAQAKRAAGDGDRFGLRPGREAEVMRRLLGRERQAATPALIVRIWRELIGDSLSRQGPFRITAWGGKAEAHVIEMARRRFGDAPPLSLTAKPEDALAGARLPGGVAVLALGGESAWWGRLLAEPALNVFATLPCLAAWGQTSALAVAAVAVEPTGADHTLWVTDAEQGAPAIIDALSRDGVAATPLAQAGGLKLFTLAGYFQRDDARLARAPGRLSGVIGAAPAPFDVY